MLTQKVIVITGGAGLLGKEFIKTIVAHNGIAIIADINEQIGEQTKKELCAQLHTTTIDFIQLDITSKDSLAHCITMLHECYGKIDALVNNAYPRNKNYGRNFFDVEYSDFCENLNLNIGGYFLASQQFGEYFRQQGYGNIINIASIYGIMAPRFEIYETTQMSMPVEYAAIKSAVIHLTKYMAKYFKGMNIRVNAISPGGILSNQPDSFLKRYNAFASTKGMLNSSDVSGTLLYLLSEISTYVNGQNIIIDDGWSL